MEKPGFGDRMNVSGSLEPLLLSREDFGKLILTDYERYGRIVKQVGVKLD